MATESIKASRSSVMTRLSIMNFLQFFVWGSWFVAMASALPANGMSNFISGTYSSAPLGAIFAPLFLGIIADRLFPSQIIFGILFLIGGAFLAFAGMAAHAGNGSLMTKLILGHMLCFMPSIGLGNSIGFSNLSLIEYPKIRVWGVVGWIIAGLLVGFLSWSSSFNVLYLGASAAILLGIYSFFLPRTPAPAKGEKIDLKALLIVDAWKLLLKPNFLIFIICSGIICIPLAYYYNYGPDFLTKTGFTESAATSTLGQMLEAVFMIMIPFFFRKLGVKWMILIGMGAWVIRYLLFAYGAPDQVTWMLLMGVALHGICYDFFFVSGFMYTDAVAPKKIRGQAQSLLVFITQGVGMYIGVYLAGRKSAQLTLNDKKDPASYATALENAVGSKPELSTLAKLTQMFKRELPESLNQELLGNAMNQWKSFWMFPACLLYTSPSPRDQRGSRMPSSA